MNEEIKNEMENEITAVNAEVMEPEETGEETGGFIGKLAIGVVGVGVVATTIYSNRHRIKEWHEKKQVERLQKKGYVISKREDFADIIEIEGNDVEETEEE